MATKGAWATVLGQAVRFNLVGVLNTSVDFCVFFIITGLGAPWAFAQVCSYGCGIATSYIGNKYWTFRAPATDRLEMLRFVVVNLTAMGISLITVFFLHRVLGLSLLAAKVGATFAAMVAGFFGTRRFVFKKRAGEVVSEVR